MKVTVKQEHIDNGKRGRAASCPIALALKDKWFVRQATVGSSTATVDRFGSTAYRLPVAAQRFVDNFDSDEPVQPFTFEMFPK